MSTPSNAVPTSAIFLLTTALCIAVFFGVREHDRANAASADRAAQRERARIAIAALEQKADTLEAMLRAADSARAVRPSVRVVRPAVAPISRHQDTSARVVDTTEVAVVGCSGICGDSVMVIVNGVSYWVPEPVGTAIEQMAAELALADSVAAAAKAVVAGVDTAGAAVGPVIAGPDPVPAWWRRWLGAAVVPVCAAGGAGVGAVVGGPAGAVAGAVGFGLTCTALTPRSGR